MAEPFHPFRPRLDPARALYDAFQAEARHRSHWSFEEWEQAEIDVMFHEARRQAHAHGLRAPLREEIQGAELSARGSADYGAKWAYRIVDAMHRPTPTPASPTHPVTPRRPGR